MMTEKILKKLKIESLSAMQQEAMNAVLRTKRDVVILSPTGSGKTLAYLLPLAELLDGSRAEVQAVVIVPGRELAAQSQKMLADMGSGLRSMALYGGRPAMDEHRQLREVLPQVVFATPGRLNDHLEKHNIDASTVRWLVVDEYDKCLAMGFREEMSRAVSLLPKVERRILLSATEGEVSGVFGLRGARSVERGVRIDYRGAGSEERGVRNDYRGARSVERGVRIDYRGAWSGERGVRNDYRGAGSVERGVRNDSESQELFSLLAPRSPLLETPAPRSPLHETPAPRSPLHETPAPRSPLLETPTPRISLYHLRSPQKDKLAVLDQLLREVGEESSIVFLNHRDSVERTAEYLRLQGFTLSMLHGGLEQKQREAALYRFSNGSATVLVCTDLGSRGLDVPDVANVIHYHLPETEQAYIHRIGRTARWNRTGRSLFLLAPGETVPEYAGDVEAWDESTPHSSLPAPRNTTVPQPRMVTIYIGKGKKDKLSKGDVVGFLCKTGGLESTDIGRIDVMERYCYVAVAREKAPQMLRRVQGQKIKGVKTLVELVR